MSTSKLPLQSFRLKNFKAVRDSGLIRFTPLTVFIGNNGSGKSSLIEGLEMFQEIGIHGIDESLQPWRGFEHVWNKAVTHKPKKNKEGKLQAANPLTFIFKGRATPFIKKTTAIELSLGMDPEENKVYIHNYHVLSSDYSPNERLMRDGTSGWGTSGTSITFHKNIYI
ncbi:MAG: AAA family ATPase [Syntrophales bacterium]|nr:AAA family ATPase [Syntrophales bacterium]